MSQELVDLARRGYEAVRSGDFDTVREAGAAHPLERLSAVVARKRGRGPIAELVELIDAGDKVVVIMHYPDPDDARAAAGV